MPYPGGWVELEKVCPPLGVIIWAEEGWSDTLWSGKGGSRTGRRRQAAFSERGGHLGPIWERDSEQPGNQARNILYLASPGFLQCPGLQDI